MKIKLSVFITVFILSVVCLPTLSYAQNSVTLSISPTIYDMSAEPGQAWKSTLKVVNVNNFDLTVYAEVVNFAPRGEGGDGRFLPVVADTEASGATLAEWFTIAKEPIVIPREQSIEIPFEVRVPKDASPGGHFAAILVGTKPIETDDGQAKLQTAQMVTSLFFARVAGDVVEAGDIREFMTTQSVLGSPEATFSLRFENKGNVHLQPRGEIKIFNMWGEERGVVPINQNTNFGNVLPDSIRKFLFTWKGEWSVSDIGRYTAVATLGYGAEEKQFSSAKAIFWVLPFKLIIGIVFGLVIFFGMLTWLVRLYVRHMLAMAGVKIQDYHSVQEQSKREKSRLHAPVQAGILDLTKRMQNSITFETRLMTLYQFTLQYRLFFLAIVLVVGFVLVIAWYIDNATTKHRAYEVIYLEDGTAVGESVNSEEILYTQLKSGQPDVLSRSREQATSTQIAIVNRSGVPGAGAQLRLTLEREGYTVESLSADFADEQVRTVIISEAAQYTIAEEISRTIGNAPVSIAPETDVVAKGIITVFVGSDMAGQ
jgi:hypothetical protein